MSETTQAPGAPTASAVLGSRVMKQVAFVVPDIEAAVATYSELLGMEPPEIRTPPPREGREYRGEPLPADANFKVAMFELDNITLDLIEPLGGPSVWQDVLIERGGAAMHHLAFEVDVGDAAAAELERRGFARLQSQIRQNGGRMVYSDAREELGTFVELLGGPPQG